ncbi:MAG TPA: hypothetical protein VNH20_00045 [Candidatus Dormibacteraeota bacterium]|nr:hypothetical protein [Candidatus Dormibacteraeota bacterium]
MGSETLGQPGRLHGRLPWVAAFIGAATFCAAVSLVVAIARAYGASDAMWAGAWLCPPLVGAVAASRRPGNAVGWLLLAVGVMGTAGQAAYAYNPGPHLTIPEALVVGLGNPLLFLSLGGAAVLILVFPSGSFGARQRRRVITVVGLVFGFLFLASYLTPIISSDAGNFANPLAPTGLAGATTSLTIALTALALVLLILVVADAVRRQRQSSGVERQQFRWLAYASVLLGVAMVIALSPVGNFWWSALPLVIASNGMAASIGLAIVRYRLYDIDRLVSRTVSYLIVVGLLTGVYAGCVLLLTSVLPLRGSVSVVVAVLVSAGLFAPVQRRARAVVDKRFNRSRYDAQVVVEIFAARLGEKVTLEAISADLIAAVRQTVQPSHASLWLRRD